MATARDHDGSNPPADGDRLIALGQQLLRERARARRKRRRWQTLKQRGSDGAEQAGVEWSAAIEAALRTAEQISLEAAADVGGLLIKFDAASWWIAEDDSLLDETARRWLVRFHRQLLRLARSR